MARDLIGQTTIAFDYLQKLYNEIAILIQEVERALAEQKEQFRIGKPSGYSVSTRGSTGLDGENVQRWLTRRFAVFFVREEDTTGKESKTATPPHSKLRVAYIRVLLDGYGNYEFKGKPLEQPTVLYGYLEKFRSLNKTKGIKFETLMTAIEYSEMKTFANLPSVKFEDKHMRVEGHLDAVPLFELENSELALKKLIKPLLKLYRKP